jgi:acetyl esterase/lipase
MQYTHMTMLIFGGCASALVGAEPSRTVAESPSGIVVHEGLVYAKPGTTLTLDLYLPASTGEGVPCVIVIQGGGFSPQDGKRFRSFAEYLAEHGFAAATIAYRGRPEHTYEDTMADARAAVRYIRRVSGEYGIDPDRIGAMGRSAGATLAALLAVTGEMEEPEGEGGEPAYSSRIQAAVGFAGVYDFVARFTDTEQIALQPRVEAKRRTNGEWIGEPFAATSEAWRNASAVNHLDAADPPTLLIHCKDDETVPWPQSQDMYARMIDAGINAEIEIYETGGHGCQTKDAAGSLARMVAFFQKTLMEPSGLHSTQ